MFLFKTSGETYRSVINNQMHAFNRLPKLWDVGEIVLISKNKADLKFTEKQIEYYARIKKIRLTSNQEIEKLWPGNVGRWKYIVEMNDFNHISPSFNLEDVLLSYEDKKYRYIQTYCRFDLEDEKSLFEYLKLTKK